MSIELPKFYLHLDCFTTKTLKIVFFGCKKWFHSFIYFWGFLRYTSLSVVQISVSTSFVSVCPSVCLSFLSTNLYCIAIKLLQYNTNEIELINSHCNSFKVLSTIIPLICESRLSNEFLRPSFNICLCLFVSLRLSLFLCLSLLYLCKDLTNEKIE
jgi:hypothetical protein